MPTRHPVETRVEGEQKAQQVARILISRSVRFTLEPWPDDEWNFIVRADAQHVLADAIEQTSARQIVAMIHAGTLSEHTEVRAPAAQHRYCSICNWWYYRQPGQVPENYDYRLSTVLAAATVIVHQRDYLADHGSYDRTQPNPDAEQALEAHQEFDDWAADILDTALRTDGVIK